MPQPDLRPNLKVSEFEDSNDFVICKRDGTLYPLNESCPLCGSTNKEIDNEYTLFKRSGTVPN